MYVTYCTHVCLLFFYVDTMVPGIKTGRRKRATSANILSPSEACPPEIGTPLTFSDETQPPDDTQTMAEETQPGGVGKSIELSCLQKIKNFLFFWVNKSGL